MREKPASQIPFAFAILACLVLGTSLERAWADPVYITLENHQLYQLEQQIGQGSFGRVFSAIDMGTGRRVAIKIFTVKEVYEAEASAPYSSLYSSQAGQHIVRVLASGRIIDGPKDQQGALVMEQVNGTLADLESHYGIGNTHGAPYSMTRKAFFRRAARLRRFAIQALQIWAGLAEKDLIFGDLKPENLGYVLNSAKEPEIKVLDLGSIVAGPLGPGSAESRITWSNGYAAPELFNYLNGKLGPGQKLSAYADLYSLGISALRLACDRCNEKDLANLIEAWRGTLPATPAAQKALSDLLFLQEFIHAATRPDPPDRFKLLQTGSFAGMVDFRRRPDLYGDLDYVDLQVTVNDPDSPGWVRRAIGKCWRALMGLVSRPAP